jgi:hypothetical protein
MLLADRLGALVINEIPAVGLNFQDSDELAAQRLAQSARQIRELISRDENHPSTIMWYVANGPLGGGAWHTSAESRRGRHTILPPALRGDEQGDDGQRRRFREWDHLYQRHSIRWNFPSHGGYVEKATVTEFLGGNEGTRPPPTIT